MSNRLSYRQRQAKRTIWRNVKECAQLVAACCLVLGVLSVGYAAAYVGALIGGGIANASDVTALQMCGALALYLVPLLIVSGGMATLAHWREASI